MCVDLARGEGADSGLGEVLYANCGMKGWLVVCSCKLGVGVTQVVR
jgi:hypothetical protein